MPRPTGVLVAWLTQWWTFLATAIVLFVPGLVAAWAIGLRRLGAWAFAPVGSIAIAALVATVYGFARIPWNLLTAVLGFVVVMAALVGCRFAFRIPASRSRARGRRWPVVAALAGGAVLIAGRLMLYIGDVSNISQSNDAPFHLGAVRAIIENATASSFGLSGLLDPQFPGAFYPGAWHGAVGLIVLLTGAGIAEATNVMTVVVGAVVWPLGIAWLTQAATGRRLAAAAAAALSPALLAFPLLMIQYGILYSYLLAVALVPASIAVVVVLTRARPSRDSRTGWAAAAALGILMALAAMGTSQPSAILAWMLAVWLFGVGGAVLAWRDPRSSRGRRIAVAAATAGGLVLLVAVWRGMSLLVTADYWGPTRSLRGAMLDVASSGYAGTESAWWVSALLAVGLVVLLVRPGARWLALTWIGLAGLYLVVAAVHSPWIRLPLVGPWYSDTYRLAALLPIATLPVAAVGVVFLMDRLAAVVRGRAATAQTLDAAGSPRLAADGAAWSWTTVMVLLAVGAVSFALNPLVQRYHVAVDLTEDRSRFVIADDTWLSTDERALLQRLADDVEPGARVLANPGTGAAFGYALSGVDVFPAKWQLPRGAAFELLGERLVDAATDAEVCAAVDQLGAQYVLDFGLGDTATGREHLPGFTGFDNTQGFVLVDREGDASLWQIAACS